MITEELKKAADKGNVLAIVKCIKAYNESTITWVEEFEDEETLEIVPIDRYDLNVLIPTDEEQDHIDSLVQILLGNLKDYTSADIYLIINNLDSYINTVPFTQELVERGEAPAMYLLAGHYYFGDEEHGIYRNPARALELYEQAAAKGNEDARDFIEQMKSDDDSDVQDINLVEYHIRGDRDRLEEVNRFLDICNEKAGYRDSAVGMLYIPYSVLMKTLADSAEYTGNLQTYRLADDELIISAECDTHSIRAFMYALYDNFDDIEITYDAK